MNILKVRHQIKSEGISFYDLPLRVAYYARVSTEFMEQLNSLENQKKFFTDYIGNMPNWEFRTGSSRAGTLTRVFRVSPPKSVSASTR